VGSLTNAVEELRLLWCFPSHLLYIAVEIPIGGCYPVLAGYSGFTVDVIQLTPRGSGRLRFYSCYS
jgi:hypothetical protein